LTFKFSQLSSKQVTKQQTREDLEIGTWKSTMKFSRTKLDQDLKLKIQKWNVYKQMASLVPWSCKL
jgi:hypothetical protein